jgi:hypothetical protein
LERFLFFLIQIRTFAKKKAMIRSLIKLGILLLAAILIYNYFFGNTAEKEQSRVFFGKVRELVVAGADVLKAEKQKFDAGKYDKLLDQLGGAYKSVREQAQYLDGKVLQRLDDLERRKAQLEQELDTIQQNDTAPAAPAPKKGVKTDPKADAQRNAKAADNQRRKETLQKELEQLYKDSESLLKEAQEQQ